MRVPDRDRPDFTYRRSARSDAPLLVLVVVLAILAMLAGCSAGSTALDEREALLDGVVFLTLSQTPAASMEALFEGDVLLDDAGCLRLVASGPEHADPAPTSDRPTAIWPHGFGIRLSIEGLEIWDTAPDGTFAGLVGHRVSLPGGEVDTLHQGIAMTAADRARALDRCPGRYWIVGDI